MDNKKAIKPCPFCGHWINSSAKKCNNCGEFLNITSKRFWQLLPTWLTTSATILIAGATIFGVIRVTSILDKERSESIKNHLTWIEVQPFEFLKENQKDPNDPSSTFYRVLVKIRNLGKETAFVEIGDWSFESESRGKFTKKDFPPKEQKFTVPVGKTLTWGGIVCNEHRTPRS
jgi:predicted nucleic acid-binding Zn ribbon protein